MTARRSLVAALLVFGCSTRILQTADGPPPAVVEDAGDRDAGEAGAQPACGPSLVERLTITHVAVTEDIRYKASGYDAFPEDARIAVSVDARGRLAVAWLDDALSSVHITPLTSGFVRAGPDTVVPGVDIGGLVMQNDGFALLTRRDDPGEPLADNANGGIGKAAMLVRVQNGAERWAVPLTGTSSITSATTGPARDCATGLNGRLAWNGAKYGAYFTVHGCDGDAHDSFYGDKLVYVNDAGAALPGGWNWNCSISQGIRLLPEADVFTSLCIADHSPFPGLDLVVEGVPARLLAPEASDVGYSGARFGSVVKTGDGGYAVAWLSRGVAPSGNREDAAKPAADMALLRLGPDYSPRGPLAWLAETPDIAETNLHVAPYGPGRFLVAWDTIADLDCSPLTCFGRYSGTHLRLMDANGRFVSPDETISAPPNGPEDIAVLPNGDLAWAFVKENARDYSAPLEKNDRGAPDVPPERTLTIAHLRYCNRDF